MSGQGLIVFIAVMVMVGILMRDKMRPGIVLLSFVVLFMGLGIITPNEALAGFSNKGMMTVALLFLVSEGVSRSGALETITRFMKPTGRVSRYGFLARILVPISAMSAFLNNTPVVVIFAPMVRRWAESANIPYKKVLIPLSFATILGGTCTLIGTSTNLVVDGLMISNGYEGIGMFELSWIGVPIAIIGLLYLIFVSPKLLPKGPAKSAGVDNDEKVYYYSVRILPECDLVGITIANGWHEKLGDLVIQTVMRRGAWVQAAGKEIILKPKDLLIISGSSATLRKIMANQGLMLFCLEGADPSFVKRATKQVEVVLANRFPGLGQSLVEFDFFRHYGAKVLAVHRNGENVLDRVDSLKLKSGDNLVLLTDDSFVKTWGESSVFYLLSEREEINLNKTPKWKTYTAAGLMCTMIAGATFEGTVPYINLKVDMFSMAAITMVLMAWLNIYPARRYTKFVSWDILITIACAFAISKAMVNSGMAEFMAKSTIGLVSQWGPHAVLAILFIITSIFTEVITNNAAAALLFPIAMATADQMEVSPMPFFITIMIAASSSFLTPIGYQTNLIVQNIGNYKFKDFIRVGLPLNILVFIISVYLIPIFWRF